MGTLMKPQLVVTSLFIFLLVGSCTASHSRRALDREDAVSWNAASITTDSPNAPRNGIHAKAARPVAERVSEPLVYSARGAAGSHATGPSWSRHAAASRVGTAATHAAPHAVPHAAQYANSREAPHAARNAVNHGSHGPGNVNLHAAAPNQHNRGGVSRHDGNRGEMAVNGAFRAASTNDVEIRILEEHNKARQEVGVADLAWDDNVAATAQEWATHLASIGCPLEHGGAEGLGQNLYWLSPAGLTPQEDRGAVQSWVDEKADWTPSPIPDGCADGKMCGHYTQVVWRDTTHVGCASAQCPDGSGMWVCDYSPPGNFVGQTPF
ncbi:unnamed protein product [Closterium sp. Naga37s-1]|nr:unnamed protein product [Closterium sp. Naga37s-1]